MNFFSYKKHSAVIVVAISLFCIMPLLWSRFLLDMDSGLRFVALAILIFLVSIYYLTQIEIEIRTFFKSKITIFYIGYLLITFVSILFSINKGEAFFELMKAILFFFLFFFLFNLLYRKDRETNVFILFMQAAVLIFCTIGLMEVIPLFKEYFQSAKPIVINYSIRSSLSNKNFFAETIALSLPFSLYGIYKFRKLKRTIAVITFVYILFFLVLLQTISTWMGLFTAAFISLLIFLIKGKHFINRQPIKSIKGKYKILFAVSVIFVASLTLNIYLKTGNAVLLKERIKTAIGYLNDSGQDVENTMVNNNSTYERMVLWRNSWKMIKEYPFGAGLNNWKIYFPKYGVTGAPFMNYGSVRFENPHNDFLFIWCEKGIFGIVFYVLLLFAVTCSSLKSIKYSESKNDKWLALFLLTGIILFICISFFGFPGQRIFSMILLVTILALVVSLEKKIETRAAKTSFKSSSKWIFIIATIISASGIYIGLKRLNSEHHLVRAIVFQKQQNWSRMIRELEIANNIFFPLDYTSTPLAWYSGFANFYSGNRQQAFEKFEEAEKVNPWHINVLNDLGTSYNLEGNVAESKKYYRRILDISPHFPDALINMAIIHYNEGKSDSALAVISKYITKDNKEHIRTIKTILYSSASQAVNSIADNTLRSLAAEKIKNEKWLYAVFLESKRDNNFIELISKSE